MGGLECRMCWPECRIKKAARNAERQNAETMLCDSCMTVVDDRLQACVTSYVAAWNVSTGTVESVQGRWASAHEQLRRVMARCVRVADPNIFIIISHLKREECATATAVEQAQLGCTPFPKCLMSNHKPVHPKTLRRKCCRTNHLWAAFNESPTHHASFLLMVASH